MKKFNKIIVERDQFWGDIARAREAYDISKKTKVFRAPAVIDYNEKESLIAFEYLSDALTVRKLLRNWNYLNVPKEQLLKLFYHIGTALAEYHKHSGKLHGDFQPNNVMFEAGVEDTIYLVDFARSELDDDPLYYQGSIYRDLALFAIHIKIKYPYWLFPLAFRKYNDILCQKMFQGYRDFSNNSFEHSELAKEVEYFRQYYFKNTFVTKFFSWHPAFRIGYNNLPPGEKYSNFKKSHMAKSFGKKYDADLFEEGLFEYEIWQKEKIILNDTITKYDINGRLLDFACGTGRILLHLENRFSESVGLDISAEMLKEIRTNNKTVKLIRGDFAQEPEIVTCNFDCITAFRFFLNADQKLRDSAFNFIKNKMRDVDSIFIFNNHGNKYSTRWFKCALDKFYRGTYPNELSFNETKQMIEAHGFKIVDVYGVGYFFKVFYKLMPKFIWKLLENTSAKIPLLRRFASNLIFVCKKES